MMSTWCSGRHRVGPTSRSSSRPRRGHHRAGLCRAHPGDRYAQNDPEYHLKFYYRIAVTENLAFTPDLQYVWNPGGDSSNDGIFAGMVRGEFNF